MPGRAPQGGLEEKRGLRDAIDPYRGNNEVADCDREGELQETLSSALSVNIGKL